jgi:hypothetical protein
MRAAFCPEVLGSLSWEKLFFQTRSGFSTLKHSRLNAVDSELIQKLKRRLRAEQHEMAEKQAALVERLENYAVVFNSEIVHDTRTFVGDCDTVSRQEY